MKLFHSPLSSNARRAVLTALELGLPVELVTVDLARGQQRQPEFLAKNPNGKVPVLEDDGFLLWESYAIMTYLANKTPGQTLYPSEARARADVDRWLAWCASQLMVGVSTLNWENVVKRLIGLGEADPARIAQGTAQVRDNVRVLDAQLADKPFVCGETLTLADLALATPFMHAESAKLPLGEANNLHAWRKRVEARDSWRASLHN